MNLLEILPKPSSFFKRISNLVSKNLWKVTYLYLFVSFPISGVINFESKSISSMKYDTMDEHRLWSYVSQVLFLLIRAARFIDRTCFLLFDLHESPTVLRVSMYYLYIHIFDGSTVPCWCRYAVWLRQNYCFRNYLKWHVFHFFFLFNLPEEKLIQFGPQVVSYLEETFIWC